MTPVRIQRKRTKGWTMPENTVYVGRPTKWGNPYNWQEYPSGGWAAKLYVTELFRQYATFWNKESLNKLRGKNLACWCRLDQPCHADILLEIANK